MGDLLIKSQKSCRNRVQRYEKKTIKALYLRSKRKFFAKKRSNSLLCRKKCLPLQPEILESKTIKILKQ